jgi:hypothetical protein
MSAENHPSCDHCGKSSVKLSKCAGCRVKQYCGKPCQVADWKAEHKHSCTSKKDDGRQEQLPNDEFQKLSFVPQEQVASFLTNAQTFPIDANVVDPSWGSSDAISAGGFCIMIINYGKKITAMLSKEAPIGSMKSLKYVPLASGLQSFTVKGKISVFSQDKKISSHSCWITINSMTSPLQGSKATLPTDCYWDYMTAIRDEVEESGGTMVKSEDPDGKMWIAIARSKRNHDEKTSVKIVWDLGPGLVSFTSHKELLSHDPMESEDADGNISWTRVILVEENDDKTEVAGSKTIAHATATMFGLPPNLCVHFQSSMGRIGFKEIENVKVAGFKP